MFTAIILSMSGAIREDHHTFADYRSCIYYAATIRRSSSETYDCIPTEEISNG